MPKIKVAVLGSTGSIGRQALNVLAGLNETHELTFISNNSDFVGLNTQISAFYPTRAYFSSEKKLILQNGEVKIISDYLACTETYSDVDIVVNGIAGLDGILPSVAVLTAGKTLATANKESLVCYGNHLKALEKQYGGKILPVDSEHSALFQCLDEKADFEKLIITASGGAFRDYPLEKLQEAKAKDALNHPNWSMGAKVTIDCATMVNKAFELIEAARLFETSCVEAVLHRESIVHAMVCYRDGSVKASLGAADMRIPIQFSLTYPDRMANPSNKLSFEKLGTLTFCPIDEKRYPAYSVLKNLIFAGEYEGTLAVVADELLVALYMQEKIKYFDFAKYFKRILTKFGTGIIRDTEDIFSLEAEVRAYILSVLNSEERKCF